MFNLIPFKRQYSGKRTQPTLDELKQIVEAIKVFNENLNAANGSEIVSFCEDYFRDLGRVGLEHPYAKTIQYELFDEWKTLEISKTEEGKFYVTITDGDDDSTFMMMDEIKDFEEIEL